MKVLFVNLKIINKLKLRLNNSEYYQSKLNIVLEVRDCHKALTSFVLRKSQFI
jgi:hypothetical protein